MVTLDDYDQRVQAEADPVAFIEQHPQGLLVIDEVPRVPRLALALKLVVDRDPRPGRFLLTGSANLNRLPATEDSLAGRAESSEPGLIRSWRPTSECRKRETRLAHRPEGYRVHFSGLLPIALTVSAALARSSSAALALC